MISTIPKYRLYTYGAAILFALAYLAWSIWGPRPPAPGQVMTAAPVKAIESMPKRVVVTRVEVIKEPIKAADKLHIDPPQPREEIQTAVTVPVLKYGGTSTVFLNTSTGQSRTVIRAAEAPWFRFERGNTFGIEAGMGGSGRYYQADYKRDVLSIKGVVLSGRIGVTSYADRTDPQIGIRGEYRW